METIIKNGEIAKIEEWLENYKDIKDEHGNTPLHFAVKYKQDSIVAMIAENENVDVNALNDFKESPLHIATKNKSTNIIFTLSMNSRNLNADIVDSYGNTPLHIAASNDDIHTLNLLSSMGASHDLKNQYGCKVSDMSPYKSQTWKVLNRYTRF